ncbi:MAG: hypothetical protein D6701_00465, partial [Gemmatimonadetes bacterium]
PSAAGAAPSGGPPPLVPAADRAEAPAPLLSTAEVPAAGPASARDPDGPADPEGRWRRVHYVFVGARESAKPHWGKHREWRIHTNIGYEGWGEVYRPLLARYLCDRLERETGVRPGGIALSLEWEKIVPPWRPVTGDTLYRQPLGGYDCVSD